MLLALGVLEAGIQFIFLNCAASRFAALKGPVSTLTRELFFKIAIVYLKVGPREEVVMVREPIWALSGNRYRPATPVSKRRKESKYQLQNLII